MGWLQNLAANLAAKKLAKKLNLQEGNMDTKKWWQSKAVWAGVVTFLVGTYEAAKPFAANFGKTLPDIPPILFTFLGALGVWGRVQADKKIG